MPSSAVENCKPWYLFFQGLASAFNTHHVSGLSAKMPLSPPMCIYLALHHTFTSASLCFLNGSKSILKDFMQKLPDLNQYKKPPIFRCQTQVPSYRCHLGSSDLIPLHSLLSYQTGTSIWTRLYLIIPTPRDKTPRWALQRLVPAHTPF